MVGVLDSPRNSAVSSFTFLVVESQHPAESFSSDVYNEYINKYACSAYIHNYMHNLQKTPFQEVQTNICSISSRKTRVQSHCLHPPSTLLLTTRYIRVPIVHQIFHPQKTTIKRGRAICRLACKSQMHGPILLLPESPTPRALPRPTKDTK